VAWVWALVKVHAIPSRYNSFFYIHILLLLADLAFIAPSAPCKGNSAASCQSAQPEERVSLWQLDRRLLHRRCRGHIAHGTLPPACGGGPAHSFDRIGIERFERRSFFLATSSQWRLHPVEEHSCGRQRRHFHLLCPRWRRSERRATQARPSRGTRPSRALIQGVPFPGRGAQASGRAS